MMVENGSLFDFQILQFNFVFSLSKQKNQTQKDG